MKEPTQEEAIKVIKEWGVDLDNFVAVNFENFMVGGDVGDNSFDLCNYFLKCLKIVTDLGIKSRADNQGSSA